MNDFLTGRPGMARRVLEDPYGTDAAKPLPAGRELDALVAEKVMGLSVTAEGGHSPRYSTDIRDAWSVIDKIGGIWEVIRCLDGDYFVNWFRDATDEGEGWEYHHTLAPTAALSICRAALRARSDGRDDA